MQGARASAATVLFKISHNIPVSAPLRLTHWALEDLNAILKLQFSMLFYRLVSSHRLMIIP